MTPRRTLKSVIAFLASAGALVALAGSGCAPGGYYNQSQSSLDSLLTTQGALMRRMDGLETKVDATKENVQASRASSDSRLGELSQRMDVLEGKLEASGIRFTELAQKVDTVKQKISSADSARVAAGLAPRDTTGIPDPEAAYQAAYSDIASGRYDLARQAFEQYLVHYPDTEVSDNAQYWIGECYYATGNFEGAIAAFEKVVRNYPKGDKVPAALFKIGVSHARLGHNEDAKRYFRQVIQKYPRSAEASLAKERLAQIP